MDTGSSSIYSPTQHTIPIYYFLSSTKHAATTQRYTAQIKPTVPMYYAATEPISTTQIYHIVYGQIFGIFITGAMEQNQQFYCCINVHFNAKICSSNKFNKNDFNTYGESVKLILSHKYRNLHYEAPIQSMEASVYAMKMYTNDNNSNNINGRITCVINMYGNDHNITFTILSTYTKRRKEKSAAMITSSLSSMYGRESNVFAYNTRNTGTYKY